MENPKMAKKVAGFFAKKGNKKLAAHEYREAAGKEKDTPAIAKREMKALKGAPAAMKNYEKKEHMGMGMNCGGMTKKYAEGGAVKKPYKPTPGDLNEKWGGDQEMENREYMDRMRKKAKPAPAPKPKMYNKGGPIAPRKPNMPSRFADSDASRAQLEKEIKERYRKSADPKNDSRLMGAAKLHNELFGPQDYAKGGMVRADGCASKGKTRGRFI